MFNKAALLTKNKFIRSVFIVASGTAGAQAIAMALTPFITRIYGPEAFGLLGSFMAVVSILTPMAALTYPIAIVLPKQDKEAAKIIKLSLIISISTSSLVMIIIALWGKPLSSYFNADQFAKYLWFIPITMLFSACYDSLSQWLIRKELFNITAKVTILQSIINNLTKIGAGLAYPFGGTLILIQTTAQAVSSSLLFIAAKSTFPVNKKSKGNNENKSLRHLAYQYRDFAVFRAPEVTIDAAAQSLPVLMLASFFGPASAGFYTLARSIMGVPSSLIGSSIGNVLYPRLSETANNRKPIYPLIKKATLLIASIGVLPFLSVVFFGPWLFSFIFGDEWVSAGIYARWLAIWLFFSFANIPSVKAIPIINAQGFQLIFTSFTIVLRLAAIALAYIIYKTEESAIIAFSLVGVLANLFLILTVFSKCKKNDQSLLKNNIKID
ncbi:lipopolysaccharide biosynthesis protein [Psychrobacter raelei]|uniref:lipopolysaccharide biosynthesis protein n=1 Tax=Psychrobacter raelei TaxID=2565531 RepID=UPI003F631F73